MLFIRLFNLFSQVTWKTEIHTDNIVTVGEIVIYVNCWYQILSPVTDRY